VSFGSDAKRSHQFELTRRGARQVWYARPSQSVSFSQLFGDTWSRSGDISALAPQLSSHGRILLFKAEQDGDLRMAAELTLQTLLQRSP